MKVAFISQRGLVGKTTYTRLVAEYFEFHLFEKMDTDWYDSTEKKSIKTLIKSDKLRLCNISIEQPGIKRFTKYFADIQDIQLIPKTFFEKRLIDSVNKVDTTTLFDFSEEIYDILTEYENTTEGTNFFSKINYIFVPIDSTPEAIFAAYKVLNEFKKYKNITFVLCEVKYSDKLQFKSIDEDILGVIDELTQENRLRFMMVSIDFAIRRSDGNDQTLLEYENSLNSIDEQNAVAEFKNNLFEKFDNVFFGFNSRYWGKISA
ncbi:MAG: hypothetical protein PHQ90_04940 [Sulfuricurvum sp.]|nr:hypothetical protein [Sulfuricurvum sp.]